MRNKHKEIWFLALLKNYFIKLFEKYYKNYYHE